MIVAFQSLKLSIIEIDLAFDLYRGYDLNLKPEWMDHNPSGGMSWKKE